MKMQSKYTNHSYRAVRYAGTVSFYYTMMPLFACVAILVTERV